MVEKFHYSAADITLLFLINYAFNFFFAKKIGKFIGIVGERKALMFEYAGLICVFIGYAVVTNEHVAAGLYVIDHLFFALALAVKRTCRKLRIHKIWRQLQGLVLLLTILPLSSSLLASVYCGFTHLLQSSISALSWRWSRYCYRVIFQECRSQVMKFVSLSGNSCRLKHAILFQKRQ